MFLGFVDKSAPGGFQLLWRTKVKSSTSDLEEKPPAALSVEAGAA